MDNHRKYTHFNLVILSLFPSYAGGHTIQNCLSFSDDVLLADNKLALLQIQGKLSPEDKFNIIMERLSTDYISAWKKLKL